MAQTNDDVQAAVVQSELARQAPTPKVAIKQVPWVGLPAFKSQRDVVQSVLNAQGCVGDERKQRRYVLLVVVKSHASVVQSLFEAQAPPNPTG